MARRASATPPTGHHAGCAVLCPPCPLPDGRGGAMGSVPACAVMALQWELIMGLPAGALRWQLHLVCIFATWHRQGEQHRGHQAVNGSGNMF